MSCYIFHPGMFKTESYQSGILFSTFFNFLSKAVLFFNSVLIAFYFGAQEKTDVYFFVFSSVNFIAYFFSALNTTVIIPESMRIREKEGSDSAMAFLNRFLYMILGVGLIFILITVWNPLFIYGLFSKFPAEVLVNNYQLLVIGIPLFGLIILTNYCTEILASVKFFSMPMIAQLINNLFVLVFMLFFHNVYDIQSIFYGLLVAYCINLVMLVYLMKRRIAWKFTLYKIKIRGKVWTDALFAQAGNFASLLGNFAPTYLFSGMTGILTALNFGQKTASMPNDLISGQFTAVAGIRFNELFARNDHSKINLVFQESVKSLLFILLPIAGFVFMFSNEIIEILYQRGKFDAETAKISAFYLKYLILIIPISAIAGLITRLVISVQKINITFYYQVAINLVLIGLIYVFVNKLGYKGYPIAVVCVNVIVLFMNVVLIKLLLNFIKLKNIAVFLGIIITEVLVCIFLANLISTYLISDVSVLIRLLLQSVAFFGIYFLINFIFRIDLTFIKELGNLIRKKT